MNQALIFSALLMGLAGTPHCLAMCGAACSVVSGGGRGLLPFHLGRLIAYAAAGALAAASVGSLATLGQAVAALRPLWTLVHVAALGLGVYLVWRGAQPEWMERLGRARGPAAVAHRGGTWAVISMPARRFGGGLAWVAWPCGLLQSALLVAGLANTAVQGALVMAVFAAASALGLTLGPALWWRLSGGTAGRWISPRLAIRFAGLALAVASAWALGHGLWLKVAAWCFG